MIIETNRLNCAKCPASHLYDEERIQNNEKLRQMVLNNMPSIELYLLGESTSANRFIYDLSTRYSSGGLRFMLRDELVEGGTEGELLSYLQQQKVLIVDCALCPLHHDTLSNKDRRDAATLCLKRHMIRYLNLNDNSPIITFFPSKRGYKKSELPNLDSRIVAMYGFSNLSGLKKSIEDNT